MRSLKTDNAYIIRIDKGEHVVTSLTEFCKEKKINNAFFRGIGAVEWLKIGYYALSEKKYYFTEYPTLLEVASLSGNVTLKDSTPFIHMHGVFSGTDNNAIGGHIEEMHVGVVLEIILTPLSSKVSRVYDEPIGLSLMDMCGN